MSAERNYDRYDDAVVLAATKAAPLFRLYGWTYGNPGVVPTHNELAETIWRLMDSAVKEPGARLCSGRFRVFSDRYGDITICLELAETDNAQDSPGGVDG